MRRTVLVIALLVLGAGVAAALATAAPKKKKPPDPKTQGRIGPTNAIQPSGRQLGPVGKVTFVGNLPTGGALTPDGRYLWTLSAGRGFNDIRIVQAESKGGCRRGAKGKSCRRKRARNVGRVIQKIPMPGLSGGIAMAPDGETVYVSGTPDSGHREEKVELDIPGKAGDVIHVFKYDRRNGTAQRDGVIPVPAPAEAPIVQDFPPTSFRRTSWPRDLAVSPDGKTLLAALNLADRAAIIDTSSRSVRHVEVGHYPYGAAITRDGKLGLVSSETHGSVAVIDLASGRKVKDIQVGPHLSHPESIAIDPVADRAYVAVTHQDLIAVIDTEKLAVERTLSVERPEGIGTAPVHVSVTPDGCHLLSANSGEDAIAVFALPKANGRTCVERRDPQRKGKKNAKRSEAADADPTAAKRRAEEILTREGRRGAEQSENEEEEAAELLGEEAEEHAEEAKAKKPARKRPEAWQLIGRLPVGSYPSMVAASPKRKRLVWIAAKGLGVGPNTRRPGDPPLHRDPGSATAPSSDAFYFKYLPSNVTGATGVLKFPSERRIRKFSGAVERQIRPSNDQKPPAGTPLRGPGPQQRIEHVFYIVRENRTYDQILGGDPRGDGDPKLELFGEKVTPNAHALARRFPLLDHVYANSEASIDGHFWTAAGSVSDYVVKNWHANYAGRGRPYDFGVYAVTWPATDFLFDQAEKQGISWFNFGEAVAGVVFQLPDKDRTDRELQQTIRKNRKSDLNLPATIDGCFPNDASSGGVDEVLSFGPGPDVEVYDSSLPGGAPPGSLSRFECFRLKFNLMLLQGQVPAFTYVTLPNDHTSGTTPGRRTPNAMIAENDYALGQFVELISNSPIWGKSLILVIEDDSQDGADHVDAHRIPAFAISPYAKRGAVVHTRYDFLSFIRTLELVTGMNPLNLFDATAVPLYDAFDPEPRNGEPYRAIVPEVNLVERNTAASPNAQLSSKQPLGFTDRTPQRVLDRILWQYVHGRGSEPPPPGPNASGIDERDWDRRRPELVRKLREQTRENQRRLQAEVRRLERKQRRR